MTIKETYQYLGKARDLKWQIEREQYKAKALEARLLPTGIAYDGVRVQTSPQDRQTETHAKLADIMLYIDRLSAERDKVEDDLIDAIDRLEDAKLGAILTAFYVNGMHVRDIAKDVNYSDDHVYTLKRQAVRQLSKLI